VLEIFLSPVAWLGALGILALRVCDMTCDTSRMLLVARGRKGIAWGLVFVFQAVSRAMNFSPFAISWL
jgi:hypothetical protein